MKLGTVVPVLLAASALTLAASAPLQAQGLGIAAGGNFNELNDIDVGSTSATFENSTGYHLGIFLELGGGPISLRPGVFYHRVGRYEFPDGTEIDLSAIEVPVDIRLALGSGGVIRPYILGAPVLTFPRTDEFSEAVEDITLTADIGAGLELNLGGLRLLPELRYGIGVTEYLSEAFEVAGTTITPSDSDRRVSKVMLRLNVMF